MKSTNKKNGRWLTLIVVVLSSFMSILDSTIINVVIPSISDYFKAGINKTEWLVSGYTLFMSIMLLCSGWFARRYGFKRVYMVGISIFTICSYLCYIAPNINFLIFMRMLQGIGSGVIIPLSMSIIAHDFSGRERGLALGIWAMAIGFSASIGPLLGGYFVAIGEWDWVFKINIPIGITLLITAVLLMRDFRENINFKFDYIGVFLLSIWTSLSLYILSSNRLSPWYLIAVVIIAFGLFITRMVYARHPLINIKIFKNRDFILAFILMISFGVSVLGSGYALSQYLLHGLNYSAFKTGVMFIPVGIIQGCLAPVTGYFTHKYGNRIFIFFGLLIILIYLYLTSQLTQATPHWQMLGTLYLKGLGIGLSFTAITNLSLSSAKTEEIDAVSGVISTVKQLSSSYAIAFITMIILSNVNKSGVIDAEGYINANKDNFIMLSGFIMVALVALFLIKKKK